MGRRVINVAFAASRREELRGDNLANDERICSESTAGQVEGPLDDDDDDLLSKSVVCAPNGDTNLNFGDDLGYLEEGGDVGVHIYDLTAMLVYGMRHRGCFCAITVCCIAYELNDFVERAFVVVPNDDGVLVLLHGVRSGQKPEVYLVGGHAGLVWRAVEGVEKKVKGITDCAPHVIPEFWREGGAERIMGNRGDVYVGDGL